MNKLPKKYNDLRSGWITCFKDSKGRYIKEGDIILEEVSQNKTNYHFEERFDMMGNEIRSKNIDSQSSLDGWVLRQIKWNKDCLVAKRIEDSENIQTTDSHYLNEAFDSKSKKIIGSVYEQRRREL